MPVGMPARAATLPLMNVQGDWREARELAAVTRAQGSPLERHMGVTILGSLAHAQGDTQLARAMVRELLPRGPASEPGDALFPYAIEILRLAARLALDASDTAEARDWLRAHDRWLRWSGAVRGRAESALLRARLQQLEDDAERAEASARESLELAADPRQPLVLVTAHRFLGRLALEARSFDRAETHFAQSRTLAEACEAPHELARTLLEIAELYRRTGRKNDVPALLETARTIAHELGAAPITAAADRIAARHATTIGDAALTPRETDVLRLVIEGITDAEVAEQLYISPRTVGQHLRSIYNKLGVNSRTAATRRAVEDGLV